MKIHTIDPCYDQRAKELFDKQDWESKEIRVDDLAFLDAILYEAQARGIINKVTIVGHTGKEMSASCALNLRVSLGTDIVRFP
jgi:hypothetical protein